MGDQLPPNLERTLTEYLRSRRLRETAAEMENKYKKDLMSALDRFGSKDDRGSSFIDLSGLDIIDPRTEEPVASIKRERRVTQSMDEETAENILRELGLYEKCVTTITVLDEDAILSLNFSGEISDNVVKMMYDEKESFAFKVIGA